MANPWTTHTTLGNFERLFQIHTPLLHIFPLINKEWRERGREKHRKREKNVCVCVLTEIKYSSLVKPKELLAGDHFSPLILTVDKPPVPLETTQLI